MDISYQTLRAIALCEHYNSWIFETLKPFLGKDLLEVGCGIGNLTRYFKQDRKLVALDSDPHYIAYMKLDNPEVETYSGDISNSNILKEINISFDTVICINVLEHIYDDEKALLNMCSLTRPQGRLILMVPAHKLLYGYMDKNVEHYRRYEKNEINEKITRAGYVVKRIFYFNRLGALGWLINSRIRKCGKISYLQLLIFDKIVNFLRKIDNMFHLPFGVSIIVIAERK